MTDLMKKIEQYIRSQQMIAVGDRVGIGLSGGADSVFLLIALEEILGRENICAVHVNHNLRGQESMDDEQFVRALCRQKQIPLLVYSPDVSAVAKAKKIGCEEAGRLCRQEAFRDAADKCGLCRIALAHHENDQAETFLFQLARGSSLAGLSGIKPQTRLSVDNGRELVVIHPLLCCTREEIERALQRIGQSWRVDRTNLENTYARNRIRNRILPMMEQDLNPSVIAHIGSACADIREADAFVQEEAMRRRPVYVTTEPNRDIRIEDTIRREPGLIRRAICMHALAELADTRKDLERCHIELLEKLFAKQTGSCLSLPGNICAYRDSGCVTLQRVPVNASAAGFASADTTGTDPTMADADLTITDTDPTMADADLTITDTDPVIADTDAAKADTGSVQLQIEELPCGACAEYLYGDWKFQVTIRERSEINASNISRKKYTKWFDYDKIYHNLTIRQRQPGDRLVVHAGGGSRKLKDYLIDEKIPARERDGIPLLAAGNQIYWVVGYRIAEHVKVTDETQRICMVHAVKKGEENKNG